MKKLVISFIITTYLLFSSLSVGASEFKNWILVYQHDSNGNAISGSFTALTDAIQNGADVRLGFSIFNDKPTSFREEGTVIYNTGSSPNEVILATTIPSINVDGSNNLTLVVSRMAHELFSTKGTRIIDTYFIGTGALDGPRITQSREIFWYISK